MMGSGTIPVMAALKGHNAIGFDVDPLALLIARTAARSISAGTLSAAAARVAEAARATYDARYAHPDAETQEFIDFWFDRITQKRLGALIRAIDGESQTLREPLLCAFSRLIITKDAGASRARDVAHSRPHVVRAEASFDPIDRYQGAVEAVRKRHEGMSATRPARSRIQLHLGDARRLPLADGTVDFVMTSPPYLHAIDYMRGHRLALVWMGHTISELRAIRAEGIGSERMLELNPAFTKLVSSATHGALTVRTKGIVHRYVDDLDRVVSEIARVLRPDGEVTFVVATATVAGSQIRLSSVVTGLARLHGLRLVTRNARPLPAGRRYLPPPGPGDGTLDRRMRREWCLSFSKVPSISARG